MSLEDSSGGKVFFGTVQFFSNQLGYGFILPDNGDKDIFVHWSDIAQDGFKTLKKGSRVSFEIGKNLRGQDKACSVKEIK